MVSCRKRAGGLRRETESRIGARREDLERHLAQHNTLAEAPEISGASQAVEEYQAELDRFVGRLAGETGSRRWPNWRSLLPEPPRLNEEINVCSACRSDPRVVAFGGGRRQGLGGHRSRSGVNGPWRRQPARHSARRFRRACQTRACPTRPPTSPHRTNRSTRNDSAALSGARNRVDLVIRLCGRDRAHRACRRRGVSCGHRSSQRVIDERPTAQAPDQTVARLVAVSGSSERERAPA